VANESLDLAKRALKDNQTRVEVGTMAPIDITAAEAEVASNEEGVILQQAAIQSAQDQLRTLVMNHAQPGFWETTFKPTDEPTLQPKQVDIDGAVRNALENRTDILQLKKQMANTGVSLKFAENQRLPNLDLQGRYGATGIGGTRNLYDPTGLSQEVIGTSIKGFGDVLRDVFANDFRTWSVQLNFSYPLGQSQADAALAQTKLQQKQETTQLSDLETAVTTQIRDAARQVDTNLKRVEATRKASELAQRRLDAENKRFTVGLSSTFELFQAQRDLSRAKQSELSALIDYNRSIVAFDAVQVAPIR
jgi:outer membrane protein TolC